MTFLRSGVCAASLLLVAVTVSAQPQQGGALPGPLPLFPRNNWWNTDVSAAPVDAGSAAFIAFINNGGTRRLHPDLGGDVVPGSVENYGFPYVVVDGSQAKKAVGFLYSDESDGVDHATNQSYPFYPIPDEAITTPHWIEGGAPGNVDLRDGQDRHLIIVDRDNRYLYELYNVYYDGQRWLAGSGAFFDMKRSDRRPDGWTSADAAGLAILPGLIRYDEVFGSRRDRARVPRDRSRHQRVRVPGITPGREQPERLADGREAAAQGDRRPLAVHARGAADLPRLQEVRAHRGRQRRGHVHPGHLRRPLGQRRAQPRVRVRSPRATSRWCSSAGSRRRSPVRSR